MTETKATATKLEEVNGRLAKGEGWIGYRKVAPNYLYYSFYVNGKQKFINSKTNDAEEAYRQLLNARGVVERGTSVLPEEAGRITYEQMRDRYTSDAEKPWRLSKDMARKIRHLTEFFGGMKVVRVNANLIRKYKERRRAQGVAGPTIRRELSILRTMFNELQYAKLISVDQVPNFRNEMPKDSKPAGTYIEPKDYHKIQVALPNGKPRQADKGGPSSVSNLVPFFDFMYATGCRLDAAQSLTWGMLKEYEGVLFIDIPGELLKNDEPISLPLTGDILQPIADDLQARRRELRKEFKDFSERLLFDSTNYRPEWAKACAKAGIGTWDPKTRTRTGVRIHDCRASAAINLLSAGVEEALVLKIGGWKTRAMLDRYVGAGAKNKQKLIEAVRKGGAYVNALMKKAQNG